MANFLTAYQVVKKIEGGYANDKEDRGGETYKGISRVNFPGWKGWPVIDVRKRQTKRFETLLEKDDTLQALVLDFYKIEFWDELGLDQVYDQTIATELFDTGVNMGTGIAAIFLQKILNVLNNNGHDYPDIKEDAKVGPVTIGYLNKHKRPGDVLKLLNCLQGARYVDIARVRPANEKFMRSWLTRVII